MAVALSALGTLTLANTAVAEGPPGFAVPGGRLTVAQRGTSTVLTHSANGRVRRLVLSAEEGICANALDSAALVGAGPGRVLILSTSYGSRPLGPTHMCGAGTETVIRVILLRPDLRQTFSERVESCWTSIEAGRIVWNRSDQTLLLETFGGPGEGHSVKTYAVQDGGAVRLQPAGD